MFFRYSLWWDAALRKICASDGHLEYCAWKSFCHYTILITDLESAVMDTANAVSSGTSLFPIVFTGRALIALWSTIWTGKCIFIVPKRNDSHLTLIIFPFSKNSPTRESDRIYTCTSKHPVGVDDSVFTPQNRLIF